MIILCIKCKLPFDNKGNMHQRVCDREHPKKKYVYPDRDFRRYMWSISHRFQDPIYQYFRLINDEWRMPTERRSLVVEAITVI